MRIEETEKIVIIGGGPVGLILAIYLARHHLATIILEERENVTPLNESRALAWMPRGIELLDSLGIRDEFEKQGMKRKTHEFWSENKTLLTLPITDVNSPFPYALDLPQHYTETFLEQAALDTGMVEIRRQHKMMKILKIEDRAVLQAESPEDMYSLSAPWAVGCDGYHSGVRKQLNIPTQKRDYGATTVVSDFKMKRNVLPSEVSRIILAPERPYGLFRFSEHHLRFLYRVNDGENRKEMVQEEKVIPLLRARCPEAEIEKMIWSSSFKLAQQQSNQYRKGKWLLAGDAAHAMGPSAGAGLQLGALGVWHLSWRLALAAKDHPLGPHLLNDYDREQHQASDQIQNENKMIFRNMALSNTFLSIGRKMVLRTIGNIPVVVQKMVADTTMENMHVSVDGAFDQPKQSQSYKCLKKHGDWKVGFRVPVSAMEVTFSSHKNVGLTHIILPIGQTSNEEQSLAKEIANLLNVPVHNVFIDNKEANNWRVPSSKEATVALIRPDQHVVGIYQSTK